MIELIEKLSDEQIRTALVQLNEKLENPWSTKDSMLYKRFQFENFIEAFGFMTKVALIAQQQNHHPDLHNSYKVVEYFLSTHKCDGISELDFNLAQAIEQLTK